jgi:hypothetical protein
LGAAFLLAAGKKRGFCRLGGVAAALSADIGLDRWVRAPVKEWFLPAASTGLLSLATITFMPVSTPAP